MSADKPSLKNLDQLSGCPAFLAWFVMPVMSIAAATFGLLDGATLTIHCERIEPRRVEEVLETSGVVTRPVERVVQEGRVDATITRRIVGLIPFGRTTLRDVIDADSSSGTSYVTNQSGRTTSSYKSGSVELETRGGATWRSPTISHAFGTSPAKMEERIEEFIASDVSSSLTLRSVPWLSNVIGIPFALVAAVFVRFWITKLAQLLGLRRP